MENQPKISTTEAVFLIMAAIIADSINWIPVVNWIVAAVMFPVTQIYFRMKGVKATYALVGNIIEMIPILSALPAYTFSIAAVIYFDRHPKLVEQGKPAMTEKMKEIARLKEMQSTAAPTIKAKRVTEVIKKL